MDLHSILADLRTHWLVYASMPFVAAAIGYVTKRVAIEMMFRPLDFVGLPRTRIGWQGVLPRNAARMAAIATQLLTGSLLDVGEVFARVDPARLVHEIEGPLRATADELIIELVDGYSPGLWKRLPARAHELVLRQVRAEVPRLVARVVADIASDIHSLLDVEDMAVTLLVRDKALLIRDIARHELAFIARCGLYFGFALGVVQTVVWALTHSPLVMPMFGLGIGWFTDWLALKMVFFPREPRRFLGLVTWQGVFQKRRLDIAEDYGQLIATEVLSTRHLLDAILRGPRSDRLFALVQREVDRAIDDQVRLARPLVSIAVGDRRYAELKLTAATRAIERLPDTLRHAEDYTTRALDVRETIVSRMRRLTPIEFEMLLRPALRQEEWKLIAVGAAIGFIVGELQVFAFMH